MVRDWLVTKRPCAMRADPRGQEWLPTAGRSSAGNSVNRDQCEYNHFAGLSWTDGFVPVLSRIKGCDRHASPVQTSSSTTNLRAELDRATVKDTEPSEPNARTLACFGQQCIHNEAIICSVGGLQLHSITLIPVPVADRTCLDRDSTDDYLYRARKRTTCDIWGPPRFPSCTRKANERRR